MNRRIDSKRTVAWALASLLVIGTSHHALATATEAMATGANGPVVVDQIDVSRGYADLAEAVMPAVVNVQITGERGARAEAMPPGMEEFMERFGIPMPDQERSQRPSQGLGSGFVIDPEGYIVTNAHVVDGATEIRVTFAGGNEMDAELIGSDEKTDLALLKVETDEPMVHVQFADSDVVRVGERVVAVGNPFGLGGTVTAGIVSAKGREIGAGPYDDFFQIDAAINRGNSGGPTFNLEGEVVGINSMIFSPSGGSVGIGFAIAANLAEKVIADLRDDGVIERGWLGVSIQTVDEDIASAMALDESKGALVSQVVPGSPAESAGLQTGDVIVGLDQQTIERVRDLTRAVAEVVPGTSVEIEVIRGGSKQRIPVSIGLMDGEVQQASLTPETVDEPPALGLTLAALTPELRTDLGLDEDAMGVVVTGVEAGSPAEEKGLRRGDVIMRFGDVAIGSPKELSDQVAAAVANGENQALLLIGREGQQLFRAVPFDAS